MSTELKGEIKIEDMAEASTTVPIEIGVEEKTGEVNVNGLAVAETITEEEVALEIKTEVEEIKEDVVSLIETEVREEDVVSLIETEVREEDVVSLIETEVREEDVVSLIETEVREEDDEEDEEEEDSTYEDTESLLLKMTGVTRLDNLEIEVENFFNFFTKEMRVAAPLIHIPGPNDQEIFFKMMSLEDRNCALRKCKLKKGYIWNTWKINLKVMSPLLSPKYKDITIKPILSLEEALGALYPFRNMPYYEQLLRKKSLSGNILTILKRKQKKKAINRNDNLVTQMMLPVTPIEGYDYNPYISLEEDTKTKKIVAGMRVCKFGKTRVVPLDTCISIPRDIIILMKHFLEKLPEIGLKAINRATRKGDIVGLGFRMTLSARYTLIVAVPKIEIESFRSMTNEKGELLKEEELQGAEDSYLVVTQKRIDEVKTKMGKYFEKYGKLRGIESVLVRFVDIYSVSLEKASRLDDNHILGSTHSVDMINGHSFRLPATKDHSVSGMRSLVGLLETNTALGAHSNIYLVSDSVIIAFYLAKKCGHVTYQYGCKYTKNELQDLAKESGIHNIQFVGNFPKSQDTIKLNYRTIVIFWNFHNYSLVDKFIKKGLTNFIFVNYWPAAHEQREEYRKIYENVCSKCRIHGIFPVDIAPYGPNFAMVLFFSGMGHNPKHVLGPPPQVHLPKRPAENTDVGQRAVPAKKKKVHVPLASSWRPPNQSGLIHTSPRPWGQSHSQTSLMSQVATGLQAVSQHIQSILPQKQISYTNPWSEKRWQGENSNQPSGGEGWSTGDRRGSGLTSGYVSDGAPTNKYTWTREPVLYKSRNPGGGPYSWTRQNF